MHSLAGRVALVTGAGSVGPGWGNGRATATLLARRGASIFAVDLDRSAAERTAEIIREEEGTSTSFEADVSDPDAVTEMMRA